MTGIPVPSQQDPQRPAAVNAPSTPPLPTGIFDMPIQSGGSLDLGPLDRGVPATPAWRLGADSNALAELDARDAEARLRAGETPTLDDLIDAERSQQDQMLALHFREAAKADPAIAGEAQRIGVELEKMGDSPLRPIIVERNIEKMRGILSQRRAEMAAAAVDSPTLRRKMSDPDFARIAFDQTDNLSFFGKLGANYDVGKLQVQRGLLGDRFRRGIGTESDLTELERVQEQLAKLPASSGNPLNGLFRFFGQFGQTFPRAFAAAGAGGGAAVALGQLPGLTFLPEEAVSVPTMATVGFLTEMWASSAKQQSGAMYLDMVDQGFDAYTSANISGAFGIFGGMLDVVGFGTLAAPAKGLILQSAKKRVVDLLAKPTLAGAAKSFGSGYAFAQGGELGTELLQTVNEIIAKEIARPEGQPGITAEEFGQQIGDTIVETFNMTAIAGGLAPSARYKSDRRKVAEAKAMGDTINRFLTKADEVRAEWVKRNPEAFGEATEEVLKEAGAPDTFYVDASKVGDILRQSDKAEAQQGFNPDTAAQVDAAIPGFSASVTQAEAEGGDVMVPAKLFVQQFGDTAFAKSLAPHLRASPNALSVTEAVEVEKQLKQADDKAERAMMEELAAVQDNFQRKLAETTDLPHDQQRHTAAIYRLMVEQIAREEKIPVAQAATLVFGTEQDADTLSQPGRGGFDPKRLAAIFTKKDANGRGSDASTIVHELVHWHVEMMARLAAAGSAFGKEMFGTLLQRWNITREQYDAMSLAERKPLLEDVSYNVEDYFESGKAPSSELRRLFERIRSFMLAVYSNIRQQLNKAYRDEFGVDLPALTPELRGYFDRMLASREAIAAAEADRDMAALFMDEDARKAAGVTDAKWAEIQKLDDAARDEAVADLASRAVRGLGAFDGARMRTVKALQQKLKATRAKVREQAEADVRARPVYASQAQIRYGEAIDDEGNAQSSKLDTDAVRAILGDDAEKLVGMTRKEGVNPDVMASMFGYTSGEAMLRDILTSPPLEDAIEAETDKRMEAEHSELADPKKLQQAVVEALAGEARGKLIASELRALLKATTPTQSMIRAAKEAARQKLLDTPVGEISTSSFVAAASRASKAAREALASGDVAAAIEAQRRYLFQNELARLSIAIEKEVDSFLDGKVAKVFGGNDDIGKTRNMDVVNVARGLLGEHDLATTSQHERALSYLNVLKERAPEVHEKLAAFVEPVAAEAKPWRKMTLDRFRALASAVGVLWHEAKRGQEFRAYDGEMLLRSTVRERLVAAAQEAGLDTAKAAQFGDEASRWSWSDIKANLTRIEQWTITMDGGKEGGVWHRYVYRTMAHAYNNYLSAALEESKYWRDTLAQFENLSGPEIDAPELGEGVKFRNREHLLGTIMHMGNDSNLANVVLSEGWGSMQKSELAKAWGDGRGKSFLVSNWWNFVNAMLERGHITTRDIDVIQERIWDHNEKVLKPLLQDTNREVYGEYVAEIKAAPFTVLVNGQAFSYRGGYVPSKVDPNAPGNQSLFDRKGFEAIMDGQAQFQTQFASVPRGSTIERKEGVIRKRVLSLRLQGQHVDEVMRFAYVQPALTDVAALFRRGDVADFLNRTQPAAIRAIIAPALERVARNRIQAPMSKNLRAVEDGANALRRNASATFLGFSIKNALQQYTGLIQSLNYVSFGRLWSALWAYRGSNGATATRMFELSTAMRNSLSDEMVALNDEIALMYDPSVLNNVRRWSNRYMMVLQRWTQFQVNAITWNAAFDEQYAKLLPTMDPDKAKAEAIERADSIVRRAQGSRTPLDVANFTAGNAVMQLFTQFQDFPNLIANQIMEAKGAKAKAAAIMLSLLLPTLASGAIALGLAGGRVPGARTPDGDDDRDGRSDDEIAAYLFGEVLRGAGSLIPIVGAPVMQGIGAGVSSRAELSPFPGFAIAEAHLRQLAKTSQRVATMFGLREPSRPSRDGAWSSADARDWAAIVGTWTGLPMGPAGRAGSFIENVEAGRSQPDSWWRTVLGVLNGR